MKYCKCKRCELNYISVGEEYCGLCKKELAGMYDFEEELNIDEDICLFCGKNVLVYGEEMCKICAYKREQKKKEETL